MKLTRMRNWAFLAMLCAAMAAFSADSSALGASLNFSCVEDPWIQGDFDCTYQDEPQMTCDDFAPTVAQGDEYCQQICESMQEPGGIHPEGLCNDGPPLRVTCLCVDVPRG